jgi:hypothetical protein
MRECHRRLGTGAGTGQWLPGADSPVQRRDRHRRAVCIDDGLVTGLYAMRNPEKLSHMQRETALRR